MHLLDMSQGAPGFQRNTRPLVFLSYTHICLTTLSPRVFNESGNPAGLTGTAFGLVLADKVAQGSPTGVSFHPDKKPFVLAKIGRFREYQYNRARTGSVQ
jgi:hypothetical protein